MKKQYISLLFGGLFAFSANADECCMTASECRATLTGSNQICCPNTRDSKKTCPTGWSLSGCYMCVRANADAGSDTKGYLQRTYGTCAASTSGFQTCYFMQLGSQCSMM